MGGGAEQRELSDRENGEDAERDVRDTADRGARARNGTFEPRIIGKHQSRFTGFDDKIISLYVRELSVREIQQHLEEIYKVEVSPGLISNVTDEVIDEAKAWQDPPPESFYPIVYMDALIFKVRDTGVVRNKAVYLAIGVNMDGMKEVLEMRNIAKRWTMPIQNWKAALSRLAIIYEDRMPVV